MPVTRSATSGPTRSRPRSSCEASWERRRARWWTITVVNVHGALVQFLGTMTDRARALPGRHARAQPGAVASASRSTVQLLARPGHPAAPGAGALYNQFLDVRVSWRRLCEPFDEPILPEEAADARPVPAARRSGHVRPRRVHLPADRPRTVLHDVSFTMEPGKVTALVGYTGAGKSSIAKLLGRTYDPDAGSVTVNGIDLRDLTPRHLPRQARDRAPGPVRVQGNGRVEHPVREARRERRRGRGRGPGGRRLGPARRCLPGGFEHVGRGRRPQPHGRATPAHRARACVARRARHARARRSDVAARHRAWRTSSSRPCTTSAAPR